VPADRVVTRQHEFIHIRVQDGGRYQVDGTTSLHLGHAGDAGTRPPKSDEVHLGWQWDGECLRVTNCRYGLIPAFYFARDDEIIVSTSLALLAERGAPTTLDDAALAVFLRFQSFVGDDTPFLHVKALPPGARLSWSRGRFECVGSIPQFKPSAMSRRAAVGEFATLFRHAIERRMPAGRLVLPLSGGRDSRHILFELLRAGATPRACVTVRHLPPRANEDERIASLICRELDLRHVVLDQPPSTVSLEVEKCLRSNFMSNEHTAFIVSAAYLGGHADCTYDGIGGDFLSAAAQSDEQKMAFAAARDSAGLARNIVDHFTGWFGSEPAYRAAFVGAPFGSAGRDTAVARIASELERHLDAPNPVASFYFWNRCRRNIAAVPFSLYPRALKVFTPYLDADVFGFLCSLPIVMTADHAFHDEAIHAAFPQWAHIPFEDKSLRTPGLPRRHARRLSRHIIQHAGVLSCPLVNRPYLVPRLFRYSFTGEDLRWLAPIPAIYVSTLYRTMNRKGAGAVRVH
jgi:hypothetical protein